MFQNTSCGRDFSYKSTCIKVRGSFTDRREALLYLPSFPSSLLDGVDLDFAQASAPDFERSGPGIKMPSMRDSCPKAGATVVRSSWPRRVVVGFASGRIVATTFWRRVKWFYAVAAVASRPQGTAVSGATSELASSALFTGCRRVPGVVRGVRRRVVRVGQPADA